MEDVFDRFEIDGIEGCQWDLMRGDEPNTESFIQLQTRMHEAGLQSDSCWQCGRLAVSRD